jgi:hypothetical protein
VIVSRHGAERLLERGITIEQCELARRRSGPPDAGNGGNIVYRGPVDGRVLKVVVSPDEEVLVTAYWEAS